jgi:hypothetical protein
MVTCAVVQHLFSVNFRIGALMHSNYLLRADGDGRRHGARGCGQASNIQSGRGPSAWVGSMHALIARVCSQGYCKYRWVRLRSP